MLKSALVAGALPVLIAGVVCAPPAQAADRFHVELSDMQSIDGGSGSFTSNIPGCATGETITVRAMAQFNGDGGVFRGTRVFVCDSGIGTVTVNLSARFGPGAPWAAGPSSRAAERSVECTVPAGSSAYHCPRRHPGQLLRDRDGRRLTTSRRPAPAPCACPMQRSGSPRRRRPTSQRRPASR